MHVIREKDLIEPSLLASFAEHGSATGVGPVKKREHVAARQTEQVHGRLTSRPLSCISPSDIRRRRETHREREREKEKKQQGRKGERGIRGCITPAAAPLLILAAHNSLRVFAEKPRGCKAH